VELFEHTVSCADGQPELGGDLLVRRGWFAHGLLAVDDPPTQRVGHPQVGRLPLGHDRHRGVGVGRHAKIPSPVAAR
jgi:hypothetical protein